MKLLAQPGRLPWRSADFSPFLVDREDSDVTAHFDIYPARLGTSEYPDEFPEWMFFVRVSSSIFPDQWDLYCLEWGGPSRVLGRMLSAEEVDRRVLKACEEFYEEVEKRRRVCAGNAQAAGPGYHTIQAIRELGRRSWSKDSEG